jgi:hypothetical protein
VLVLGLVANGVELLLLEHHETPWQWAPLAMILVALVASAVMAFRPTRASVWGFRAVMVLMIVTGALGLIQHYRGNMLFELEMRPTMEGFDLFRESMMGATPALAPGMMAHLGLIGLALTYRHPLLARRERDTDEPAA